MTDTIQIASKGTFTADFEWFKGNAPRYYDDDKLAKMWAFLKKKAAAKRGKLLHEFEFSRYSDDDSGYKPWEIIARLADGWDEDA